MLKWWKIQSLILDVLSLILFTFRYLFCILFLSLFVFSLILYVFSLILFIFSQLFSLILYVILIQFTFFFCKHGHQYAVRHFYNPIKICFFFWKKKNECISYRLLKKWMHFIQNNFFLIKKQSKWKFCGKEKYLY